MMMLHNNNNTNNNNNENSNNRHDPSTTASRRSTDRILRAVQSESPSSSMIHFSSTTDKNFDKSMRQINAGSPPYFPPPCNPASSHPYHQHSNFTQQPQGNQPFDLGMGYNSSGHSSQAPLLPHSNYGVPQFHGQPGIPPTNPASFDPFHNYSFYSQNPAQYQGYSHGPGNSNPFYYGYHQQYPQTGVYNPGQPNKSHQDLLPRGGRVSPTNPQLSGLPVAFQNSLPPMQRDKLLDHTTFTLMDGGEGLLDYQGIAEHPKGDLRRKIKGEVANNCDLRHHPYHLQNQCNILNNNNNNSNNNREVLLLDNMQVSPL